MKVQSESAPPQPLSLREHAERIRQIVRGLALLAECSAATRSEVYKVVRMLNQLNQQGIVLMLRDLQHHLADPALRRTLSPVVADLLEPAGEPGTPPGRATNAREGGNWLQQLLGGFRGAAPARIVPDANPDNTVQASEQSAASSQLPMDASRHLGSVPVQPAAPDPAMQTPVHSTLSAEQDRALDATNAPPVSAASPPAVIAPAGMQDFASSSGERPSQPEEHLGPDLRPPAQVPVSAPAVPAPTPPVFEPAHQPIVPAPFTTGRWDSGRRARLAGHARFDPAPPSPADRPAVRQSAPALGSSGQRSTHEGESDLVRAILATDWIPRSPEPPAADPSNEVLPQAPTTRRWELLSRFDSGARPAFRAPGASVTEKDR